MNTERINALIQFINLIGKSPCYSNLTDLVVAELAKELGVPTTTKVA